MTAEASTPALAAPSAAAEVPVEARPPERRPRPEPPTPQDASAVDGRPRASVDTPRPVVAPEPARPLPPEAPPRLPEHLSVQVDDPQGDWQIDVHRRAGHVDLDIRASAEVQQVVREAEPELRARLASGDSTLGQLSFSQGSPRREHAPPEPPAPPRAPRVVRAPPAAMRVARLLDRDA